MTEYLFIPATILMFVLIYLGITMFSLVNNANKLIEKHLNRPEGSLIDNSSKSETNTFRIQAYERMSLFLERISINNLVIRSSPFASTVTELRQLLLEETRNELNHNLSQQIYMSHDLWLTIQNTVNNLNAFINENAIQLDPNAPAKELAIKLLENTPPYEQQITTIALQQLKAEIQTIF